MAQAKKNLGIRADQERWLKINEIARGRNSSVQKLVDEAIDRHLLMGTAGPGHDSGSVWSRTQPSDQRYIELIARAASVLAEMISMMQDSSAYALFAPPQKVRAKKNA